MFGILLTSKYVTEWSLLDALVSVFEEEERCLLVKKKNWHVRRHVSKGLVGSISCDELEN